MPVSAWIAALGIVAGMVAFGRPRRLRPVDAVPAEGPAGRSPSVAIIIPARNEERSLGLLLGDLARSRPAGSRVIVVDDHSSDRTAEVASQHGFVRVVPAPDLPAGWTGKTWACHTGASVAAHGGADTLIFLDADVRVADGALDSVLAARRERGGVVSVQPRHVVRSAYERLSAIFNVVSMAGTGAGWPRPTGLFGPVLCMSLGDYRRCGGHSGVRGEVIEDIALGRAARRSGVGVALLAGGDAITFRMYPDGLRQLVEGWSKNFASGAGSAKPLATVAITAWITALLNVSWQLGLATVGASGWSGWVLAALGVATVASVAVLFSRVGNFGVGSALLFPVATLFFVAVFVRSAYLTVVRREVTWRGRALAVGTAR